MAILAYAGYVSVFPGLIGLSMQLGQYRALGRQVARRRKSLESLLGEAYVATSIGDRVTKAQGRWRLFFVIAVIVYVAVVVLALVGAIELPHVVIEPSPAK